MKRISPDPGEHVSFFLGRGAGAELGAEHWCATPGQVASTEYYTLILYGALPEKVPQIMGNERTVSWGSERTVSQGDCLALAWHPEADCRFSLAAVDCGARDRFICERTPG